MKWRDFSKEKSLCFFMVSFNNVTILLRLEKLLFSKRKIVYTHNMEVKEGVIASASNAEKL
jgi:hypothetical protein